MSDLLPSALRGDPLSKAFDAASARLQAMDLTPLRLHPSTCPVVLLPLLCEAWGAGGALYDLQTTEAGRRTLYAAAPTLARIRGTRAGIVRTLELAGLPGAVVTAGGALRYDGQARHDGTHLYGSSPRPWHFGVTVPLVGSLPILRQQQLLQAIRDAAPLWCRLAWLRLTLTVPGAVVPATAQYIRVGQGTGRLVTDGARFRTLIQLRPGPEVSTATLLAADWSTVGTVALPVLAPDSLLSLALTLE